MAVNFLFVVFFALKLAAGSPATIINRNPYAPLQPSNSGKHSVKTVKLYPHESFPTCETNIVTAVSRDNRKWGWEKRRSCIMPEDLDKYEYKLNEEQSPEKLRDAKSRSVKLYPGENFPVCSTNVVTAISSDNRKWGWENSKSCIMPDGLPNYEYKVNNDQQGIKPVGYENCKNQDKAKVTVYGADGKLWGYENGKSCRIVNAGGTDNEKNHHNPSNRTLGDTAKGNTTGGFIPGRASYYPGPWEAAADIHNLACRFKPSTKYYGAISDLSPAFDGPQCIHNPNGGMPLCKYQKSCGRCFEVRCVSKFMWYDSANKQEKGSCLGANKSVVIQIADACPNIHPINGGKKGQNPCGETSRHLNHFDLNRDAFKEIAKENDGIIHMEFREVGCGIGVGLKQW